MPAYGLVGHVIATGLENTREHGMHHGRVVHRDPQFLSVRRVQAFKDSANAADTADPVLILRLPNLPQQAHVRRSAGSARR